MKSFTYVIKDSQGVHARPAGIVVAEAKKYASNVTITTNGKSADLKRIFGVMGLCIKCGQEVTINVSGEDEDSALENIKRVFVTNL